MDHMATTVATNVLLEVRKRERERKRIGSEGRG